MVPLSQWEKTSQRLGVIVACDFGLGVRKFHTEDISASYFLKTTHKLTQKGPVGLKQLQKHIDWCHHRILKFSSKKTTPLGTLNSMHLNIILPKSYFSFNQTWHMKIQGKWTSQVIPYHVKSISPDMTKNCVTHANKSSKSGITIFPITPNLNKT